MHVLRTLFLLIAVALTFPVNATAETQTGESTTASEAKPSAPSEAGATWICPMECDGLDFDEPGDCPICGMHLERHAPAAATSGDDIDTQIEGGGFFDADSVMEDTEELVEKPKKALMPGLSNDFFYVGAGLLLLLTLGLLFIAGEPKKNMKKTSKRWEYPRFELTKFGWMKRLVKWKGFQPMLQLPVLALFALVIAAGLFGNQDPGRNIAPVLTWNIWWMGLIFFAFFAGEIWCTVCPWMAVPDWLKRGWAKLSGSVPGAEMKWPTALRNLYPAIGLFLVVTWLELVYEAPYRPALTAVMGLGMVGLAAITLFAFERKGFCRYLCPVGRVTGQYGTTGMLEIRRKDTDVCHACETKDCFHGNEDGLPCPTHEFMGAMNENTYCTMCTECLKTCPHDNIGLNVRAPLADLIGPHRKRLDEAWLLMMLLGVTVFHGLAMIPLWTHDVVPPAREWTVANIGFDPGYMGTFTAGMVVFFAGTLALYLLMCWLVKLASGNVFHRMKDYFISFSYVLLPVALAYHLAHNSLHFFYEGSKLVRLASDPFGWGWDLFGTVDNALTMLLPMDMLWGIQIGLVVLGQVASVWIARRTVWRLFGNRKQRWKAMIPLVIFIGLVSIACLWLLNQPMEMRTA